MRAESQDTQDDREVETIARALHERGAVTESVALLRGAVRRDPRRESPGRRLLARMLANEPLEACGTVELDFSLADRWIRRGMLVEALALLGGTSLGSGERGREWANLLGELLAPVPVDAEPTLVEMHRQLLSGGASVALTLLEERSREAPSLPAWAQRRLELLRWMLLDNAAELDSSAPLATSPLADAIAGPLTQKGIGAGHAALEAYLQAHPDDPDAQRTMEAFEALLGDFGTHGQRGEVSPQTLPMVGHTAALMQLRMGNLANAAGLYRRILDGDEGDDRAHLMLVEVEVLQRVLDGQPVAEVELPGEDTRLVPGVIDECSDEDSHPIPATAVTRLAESETRRPPKVAEPLREVRSEPPRAQTGHGETQRLPGLEAEAERLVMQGRTSEAEDIYRGLANIDPECDEWLRRADALRVARTPSGGLDAASARPVSERPISERPISERPISERPVSSGPVATDPEEAAGVLVHEIRLVK